MKNIINKPIVQWLLKFISAMGMTSLLLIITLIVYTLMVGGKANCDRTEFALIMAGVAIYLHFRDYVESIWKKK